MSESTRSALLDEVLGQHDIDGPAAQRIIAAAEPGIFWGTSSDAATRSRIGGPAVVPVGSQRPRAGDGSPLSLLAALALDELPAWTPLPGAGWLLFFAAFDEHGLDQRLAEPAANAPGSAARVLFAGDALVEAEPAPAARVVRERRIVPLSAPTVPDDQDAPERLELGEDEAEAYEELAAVLRYGPEGWSEEPAAHWTLGAWSTPGYHEPDDGSLLLLELTGDPGADLALGAAALQFRIPADDLAGRRWEAVTAQLGQA